MKRGRQNRTEEILQYAEWVIQMEPDTVDGKANYRLRLARGVKAVCQQILKKRERQEEVMGGTWGKFGDDSHDNVDWDLAKQYRLGMINWIGTAGGSRDYEILHPVHLRARKFICSWRWKVYTRLPHVVRRWWWKWAVLEGWKR